MECCLTTMHALSLVPDADLDEVRLGQLVTLVVGLSLVLIGRLAILLL